MRESRRSVLSTETVASICSYIEVGGAEYVAAEANGVAGRTFRLWVQRGKEAFTKVEADEDVPPEDEPYYELYKLVRVARSKSEMRNVNIIAEAATGQWQAAAWLLERRYPQRYGRREKLEHSGPQGGPIVTRGTVMLADLQGALATARANQDDADRDDEPSSTPRGA